MTRREEIVRESWKRYPNSPERNFGTGDYEYPEYHDDEREAFEKGAYWADKTMIDKACEWLDQNVVKYESGTRMGYIPFSFIEDMINDFRKAMEE